jgi:histone-binding protein RBBP4
VEDICFAPDSKDVLCSVSVDKQLIFWDLRIGTSPIIKLKDVHKSDINTVDWSTLNPNLVATGSEDTIVKVLDVRRAYNNDSNQNPIVKSFHKHKSKVQGVKFSPFNSRYLASSGDSLIFWDLQNVA